MTWTKLRVGNEEVRKENSSKMVSSSEKGSNETLDGWAEDECSNNTESGGDHVGTFNGVMDSHLNELDKFPIQEPTCVESDALHDGVKKGWWTPVVIGRSDVRGRHGHNGMD